MFKVKEKESCDSGKQFAILKKEVRVDLIEMTFKQTTRKERKAGGRTYQA